MVRSMVAAMGGVLLMLAAAQAQERDRIEPGIPVPSADSLGRAGSPGSDTLNPGLRDDPNSPLGPALGTAGTAPDGSLNPTSGTMANPSQ